MKISAVMLKVIQKKKLFKNVKKAQSNAQLKIHFYTSSEKLKLCNYERINMSL